MVDFSNLKKRDVTEKPVKMVLDDLADDAYPGGLPFLEVLHAGERNKPYFNELLKQAKKAAKVVNAGALNADTVSKTRENDRELYAKFIIKGWGNVVDSKGKPVQFNQENLIEFLTQLPDWLFDKVRQFASNIQNFVDVDAEPLTAQEVEAAGKNS